MGPSVFSNTLHYVHTVESPEAMFELGKRIGSLCKAGDLILLNGPLGAGKTGEIKWDGAARKAVRASKGLLVDPDYRAPLLKFYGE